MLSKSVALMSMVALLFPMVFFMLATPPLLVLKHDTPQDSWVIRGLFHYYYRVVMFVAAVGTVGHALFGSGNAALVMASVGMFVFVVRQWFIPRMDLLRALIATGDTDAKILFRRLHIAGMLLNVVQIGVVAWGMSKLLTL